MASASGVWHQHNVMAWRSSSVSTNAKITISTLNKLRRVFKERIGSNNQRRTGVAYIGGMATRVAAAMNISARWHQQRRHAGLAIGKTRGK